MNKVAVIDAEIDDENEASWPVKSKRKKHIVNENGDLSKKINLHTLSSDDFPRVQPFLSF